MSSESHPTYPLTKQQEGLWVEWRLHPENTSYNTCVNLRLKGDLDEKRLEQALHDVVRFFSSLRMYFLEKEGMPYQAVSDDVTFRLEYQDISIPGQVEETPEQHVRGLAFLERKISTPVDLMSFPISHAGLMKTAPQTYYFIGMVPHIISDGASAILFLDATSIAYNKGYQGLEEHYGTDEKTWDDYFNDYGKIHSDEFNGHAADYWKERLNGVEHTVNLGEINDQVGNKNAGKRTSFHIDEELSAQLKAVTKQCRTTMFNVLAATFAVLINRLYGQQDVTIGYPVNIRPRGYKNFFGFFVNIIPIRINSSGNPTFKELVNHVSAGRKHDKKYQAYPALDIVRNIRKEQEGFDGRVFNISMAQTISRLVNLSLDGIDSEPLEVAYNDVNDDLSLSYELLEDGRIGLWFEYREALFSQEAIATFKGYIHRIIQQLVQNPDITVSDFELLNPDDKQELIKLAQGECNHSNSNDNLLHSGFEEHAKNRPDDIALLCGSEVISYGDLNRKSNALSIKINKIVKGNNVRVAVQLERGKELLIALLAVIKSGHSYVPLSPEYPQERSEYIIKDANCSLLIGNANYPNCQTLTLQNGAVDEPTTMDVGTTINSNDFCYAIYTSGSTGKPKGVAITHANISPRMEWLVSHFPLKPGECVLQNTDVTFDVSVAEVFWPLSQGATLVLTDQKRYKDPSYLIDLIETNNIVASCMVPSLLQSVISVLRGKKLQSMKYLLAAGEALAPSLVKLYYQHMAGTLYNVYGPTEASVYASCYACADNELMQQVPIGKALSNTELYLLDEYKQLVPKGAVGELYIGGSGVSDGYINLTDKTAESFVECTIDDEKKRLYKTGDLAKLNKLGQIEYLGRIDSQVKIRGYRIELGEIASVIHKHNDVVDVAVVDSSHLGGAHKTIVAYIEMSKHIENDVLRRHCAAYLPDYMLPSSFIVIDAIPRLPSGKLNRSLLPKPMALAAANSKYVKPESEKEVKITQIFAKLLKRPAESIGANDDFFELGGDSLMAIQFVCLAENEGLYFKTSSLFEKKTPATLAELAQDEPIEAHLVQPDQKVEGTFGLLPRQLKFFDDKFINPHHWNRFFYFDVDHVAQKEHVYKAFSHVLQHHDILRVSFHQDDRGQWQQSYNNCINDDFLMELDLTAYSLQEQHDMIVKRCNEYQGSLSLHDAPLIRLLLFKISDSESKIAIIAHHLLLDMVSSRIIFEDFLKSYETLRTGFPMPLANKTHSVKQLVDYLDKNIAENDISAAVAYWGDSKMALTTAPKSDISEMNDFGTEETAQSHILTIDAQRTNSLIGCAQKHYASSIQAILFTALSRAYCRLTGQDKMVVNVCGHGRNISDSLSLERTVGWINTVYPIYLEAKSAHDYYHAVKHTQLLIDKVPEHNELYNFLRYRKKQPELIAYDSPSVFFNYVSQIDAFIADDLSVKPAFPPKGIMSSSPQNHLCYALYMEAVILNKQLQLSITYGAERYSNELVASFAEAFELQVNNIINETELKAVS